MVAGGVPCPQCPHIPSACGSAGAESSRFNSALQPKAGQRKGPVAAKKSRSRSAPPAPGLEPRHRSASALALPRLRWQVAAMEEMLIWEQHTVTLSKDPHRGFGFAVSGGRDRPNRVTGDTAVIVSDVVSRGPAFGQLQRRDQIVMVNGLSMENVSSSFAIQTLKTCGKIANIVSVPCSGTAPCLSPSCPRVTVPVCRDPALRSASQHRSRDDLDHNQGYDGDSSSERSSGHHRDDRRHHKSSRSRRRSQDSSHWRRSPDSGSEHRAYSRHRSANGFGHEGDADGLALVSGFKRLPRRDVPMKPITSVVLVGWRRGGTLRGPASTLPQHCHGLSDAEYGLKLGSQLFIKHIVESGLAARRSSLQEGDLILKINGVASEDMSLADTQRLIEQTEGILTLLVLRDHRQFLINIPNMEDYQSDSSRMDGEGTEWQYWGPTARRGDWTGTDASPLLSLQISPTSTLTCPTHHPLRPPHDFRLLGWGELRALSRLQAPPYPHSHPTSSPRVFPPLGRYSPDSRVVQFVKARSVGLRLAGGNDVGIFVSGVQEGSPADSQGIEEGDQILQVNGTSFQNLTREEAVQYLMRLPPGEDVTLRIQSKQDIYRKMVSSNVGDSFYIRTHFDYEKDTPSGLSFVRGDVFHVLDTTYRGKLGSWLAVRVGRNLQEQEKGIIPNQSSLESVLKATPGTNPSGARAEFWKLRGLRGAKKMLRKSREDLSALTKQGHYPPYERVVLKEGGFKRPVVILGPITDIAMQKLSELCLAAGHWCRWLAGALPQDKHALLDITPSAVERLNYVQYYPVVVFCEPESRQGIKAMRQWLAPDSRKSSRRLYAQASKMKKYCSHLFTATISLSGSGNSWYEEIKGIIRTQQGQPIWTTDGLELLNPPSRAASGYLTCDSHANSDYDDTDGEGGAYTDGEAEDAYNHPALSRSSEPAQTYPSHGVSEQVEPGHGGEFLSPVALAEGLSPLMSAGPVLVPCPPVAPGECSPVPSWGTTPACPPLKPVCFSTGDRAAAAGAVGTGTPQVPCVPGPALCSLALCGSGRLHRSVTEVSLQHLVLQGLRARSREEEIHTSQG
uniref:Tight junction protein 3 n=1 Tax=Pavo cristatus TaxID=9049 RepID=A0A8C9EIH2_PAVCR